MGARVTVIAVPHALFILVQALVGAPALDIHGICFSGAILKRCDVQIIVFVGNPAGVAPSVLVRIAPYKVHVRTLLASAATMGMGQLHAVEKIIVRPAKSLQLSQLFHFVPQFLLHHSYHVIAL